MTQSPDSASPDLGAAWRAWLKERPQYREATPWVTQVPDLVDAVRGGSNSGFNRDWPDGQVETDYFAMLNDRALLEDEIEKLPPDSARELREWLDAGPDLVFREVTEDRPVMAWALAWADDDDEGWWWRRAPRPGWLRDALERKVAEHAQHQRAVEQVKARLADPSRLNRHVVITLQSGTQFTEFDSIGDDELIRRTEVETRADGQVRLVRQLVQVLEDGTEKVLKTEVAASPDPATIKGAEVRFTDFFDR